MAIAPLTALLWGLWLVGAVFVFIRYISVVIIYGLYTRAASHRLDEFAPHDIDYTHSKDPTKPPPPLLQSIHLSITMHVLLLGGHGKIALHLTPLLLNRAWSVTSVVRNAHHESEILALGKGRKGKLDVLISSLDDVKSAADAQKILDTVGPDYVVWSAGTLISPLSPHFDRSITLTFTTTTTITYTILAFGLFSNTNALH